MATDGVCIKCSDPVATHLRKSAGGLCFTCVSLEAPLKVVFRSEIKKEKTAAKGNCYICKRRLSMKEIVLSSKNGDVCEPCLEELKKINKFEFADYHKNCSKRFLIKSNGQVVGPLEKSEVETKLMNQEFYILDESSFDGGRWGYLRDNPQFENIVRQLKQRKAIGEDSISTDPEHTQTVGTTTDRTVIGFGGSDRLMTGVKQQVDSALTHQNVVVANNTYEAPTYEAPIAVKKKTHLPIAMLVAIAVIVGGVIFKARMSKREYQAENIIDIKAKNAYMLGDFTKAIPLYEELVKKTPSDLTLQLTLAELMIEEQRGAEANVLLEEIASKDLEAKFIDKIKNLSGMILLQSKDFMAAEKVLQESVDKNSNNNESRFNLAAAKFHLKKFRESEMILTDLISKNVTDGAVILLLAETAMSLSLDSSEKPYREMAMNLLTSYSDRVWDYRLEAVVKNVIIHLSNSKVTEADALIDKALLTDPEITEMHRHNPALYRGHIDWNSYLTDYRKVSGKSTNARAGALEALILLKANQQSEAAKMIESVVMKTPQDSLAQSEAAFILKKVGKEQESQVALRLAQELSINELSILISARNCEDSNDWSCALAMYEKLRSRQSTNLSAQVGIAKVKSMQGDRAYARKEIPIILSTSQFYRPALELKMSVIGGL